MIKEKVLLIQRFYPNYREGLFDRLAKQINLYLICHSKSHKKIITPTDISKKTYVLNGFSVRVFDDIILFPFLLFQLIYINPDRIVTEGGKNTINNLLVVIFCKVFGKQYIIWDLGKGYIKETRYGFLKKTYLQIQRMIVLQSQKILTYNNTNIEYFKKIRPGKEVVALGNTIDTERINEVKKKNILANDIPDRILKQEKIFLYVGALNEKKKVHELSQILKYCTNFGLIIIGDGEENYKTRLKNSLIGVNYVMVGYKTIEDLAYYYKISDLVILPGLGGLTITQSYMFEVPVLCSRADGTEEEIIINNENGFIFQNIPEAQYFLANNSKADFKEMGRKGFKYVSSNFTISNYCQRFIDSVI